MCLLGLTVSNENICTHAVLFFNLVDNFYSEFRNMEVLRIIFDHGSGGWGEAPQHHASSIFF